mgnify:CR=1 FL=1
MDFISNDTLLMLLHTFFQQKVNHLICSINKPVLKNRKLDKYYLLSFRIEKAMSIFPKAISAFAK